MTIIEHPHSLAQESIDHDNRARYLAAAAVRDFQRGNQWDAMRTMAKCAMERHLAYEKWDTAQIAWAAQKECWAPRG
jgi:hypothetical protein